ncbi:MAG: hypothetical protein WBB82_16820 [Limnothrix sp.]
MRKVSVLLPILALTLTLGSCSLLPGGGGDDGDTLTEPQAEDGSSQPIAVPPTPAQEAESAAAEITEETSDILTPSGATSSVFIPSTDADARRKVTAQGRTDPFSDFPFSAQVTFAPPPAPEPKPATPVANRNVPAVRSLAPVTPTPQARASVAAISPASKNTGGGSNSGGGSATAGSNNGGTTGSNSVAANPNATGTNSGRLDLLPILPELPQATLAERTDVTGVIRLNGVDNVMVKAPNEEYSRYVKVGDLIANGQVKVKRVDFRRNSPVIVLEENGIEIFKQIEDVLLADRNAKADSDSEAMDAPGS